MNVPVNESALLLFPNYHSSYDIGNTCLWFIRATESMPISVEILVFDVGFEHTFRLGTVNSSDFLEEYYTWPGAIGVLPANFTIAGPSIWASLSVAWYSQFSPTIGFVIRFSTANSTVLPSCVWPNVQCSDNPFMCVSQQILCDGKPDCEDLSDELNKHCRK